MTQKKNIAIIGSTGSIGTQTLDVVSEYPHLFSVKLLTAGSNVDLLVKQSIEHRPSMAIIADETKYEALREALQPYGIATEAGARAIADAMERDDFSMVVTATVGYSGLEPTIRAIRSGKDIALANKETLVVAGEYVSRLLEGSKSRLYPVDSEHSAIYQCLVGESQSSVSKLIITASGGPFRTLDSEALKSVTVDDALCHPKWSMGAKITIDSATMLNKAFEIIEARWLFGISPERIKAVVHPQSIVHSMVEFQDGAIKAQLGLPDMRLPISYALAGGERLETPRHHMKITDYASLTFEEPDVEKFPCLNLAYEALSSGGTTACIINAANEIAVASFLSRKIKFLDIYKVIRHTLNKIPSIQNPEYDDYVATNNEARIIASQFINEIIK